jgi:hypothetical protein
MDAKKIRLLAKLSKTEAAALAHVAPLTWRIYETDRNAVSEEKRIACDAAVERMREIAAGRSAA